MKIFKDGMCGEKSKNVDNDFKDLTMIINRNLEVILHYILLCARCVVHKMLNHVQYASDL